MNVAVQLEFKAERKEPRSLAKIEQRQVPPFSLARGDIRAARPNANVASRHLDREHM
jgi:hypothetical protein